ncbi:MAG: PEP-CTERM sorting domain-containing protein [Rhodocyclaceae bacterium]|nr:PEP-CTERM sorting domain-containing protein [Rhodocyclaceae bacterium]
MYRKLISVPLLAGALALTPQAHASLWTYTVTGTVNDGYDYSGVFGSANTSLVGKSFSFSLTLDPTLEPGQSSSTGDVRAWGGNGSNAYSYSATIGGHTYSSSVTQGNSNETNVEISTLASGRSQATMKVIGWQDAKGNWMYLDSSIWSWASDVVHHEIVNGPAAWTTSFTYTNQNDPYWTHFYLTSTSGTWYEYAQGAISTVTVSAAGTQQDGAVPEPGISALLGVGLAGLLAARRRKAA